MVKMMGTREKLTRFDEILR